MRAPLSNCIEVGYVDIILTCFMCRLWGKYLEREKIFRRVRLRGSAQIWNIEWTKMFSLSCKRLCLII